MTIEIVLPRYCVPRRLADGRTAFYWTCPKHFRDAGCHLVSAPLGTGLSQAELDDAAKVWNGRLDEWRADTRRGKPTTHFRFGTVGWLFDEYLRHEAFLERVGEFSRPDYRRVFDRIREIRTKDGKAAYGDLPINRFGVKAAQRVHRELYEAGARRTAEKAVTYASSCWQRMWPHHPRLFRSDVRNPWEGVTRRRRDKAVKPHATRAEVYAFANGALAKDRSDLAAAAVLAFEFFLRPSSIGAGWAQWSGYRGKADPDCLIVQHRKNGSRAVHPLEAVVDGAPMALYADAEAVLAKVKRVATSIVARPDGTLYGDKTKLPNAVRKMADKLKMPRFTIDAARHGGMTELEEAGLTEGQGRILTGHRTGKAYRGYAKETKERALRATMARFGHFENGNRPLESRAEKTGKAG